MFGDVSLLIAVALLGYNLTAYPYSQAVMRFYPELCHNGTATLFRAAWDDMRIPILVLVALQVAGGAIFLGASGAVTLLAVAIIFYVDVVRTIQTSFFNAARNQRAYSLWSAADVWVRPLAALVAVKWFGPRTVVVLWAYALGVATLVPCFRQPLGTRGEVAPPASERQKLRRALRQYAIPLMPLAITAWISTFGDRYFIRLLLTAPDVGIYAAVYGLSSRPFTIFNAILIQLFRPIYFDHLARGERETARRIFTKWIMLATSVMAAGVVVAHLSKRLVVYLTLNERFRSGVNLIVPIALGHALLCLAQTMNVVSLGNKRPHLATIAEATGAIASLSAIPLIYRYGIIGAAWAVPIYYGLQCVVATFLAAYSNKHHSEA